MNAARRLICTPILFFLAAYGATAHPGSAIVVDAGTGVFGL
jgi:hypothetical protein